MFKYNRYIAVLFNSSAYLVHTCVIPKTHEWFSVMCVSKCLVCSAYFVLNNSLFVKSLFQSKTDLCMICFGWFGYHLFWYWHLSESCFLSMAAQYVSNKRKHYIEGLVQDCSNSITNTLELLQSCTLLPLTGNLHSYWLKTGNHMAYPGGLIFHKVSAGHFEIFSPLLMQQVNKFNEKSCGLN